MTAVGEGPFTDWYEVGCHKSCRFEHNYVLGLCARIDTRPADMPSLPSLTVLRRTTATNGEQTIVTEQLTFMALVDLLKEALHEVDITLGPNSLRMITEGTRMKLTDGEYQNLAIAAAAALTKENR